MEHPGQGAEEQTPQEFPQSWEASGASSNAADSANNHPLPPPGPAGRRASTPAKTKRAGPGSGALSQPGRYDANALLSTLAALSRALAGAESSDILSLALRALLTLTAGESGLALTCPEEVDLCRVAIRQNMTEELAEACIGQSALLKAAQGELISLSPASEGQSGEHGTGGALLARLAQAGARWYLPLPLRAQGQVEAVVVALGQQEPIYPAGSLLLSTGVALLGEMTNAALERARLRNLLIHEGHARDEFIGLASHELKSPLTIIKGYAQLLLRQAKRSASGAVDMNGLEAISQQVTRMSLIVGQLLDVSRIERNAIEMQPQQTDLVALARRVVEQRQKTLTGMMLHLLAREPGLIVSVDPARLEQILNALLDNAIKFGPEQGMVEVTIERALASAVPDALRAGPTESDVSDGAPVQNEIALISVRDYGLGVPVEERGNLFKAFYRGPENSQHRQLAGLGLGLYLNHYLATRQGGRLWAEFPDTPGLGGSLFRMSFPLLPTS